MKRPDTPSPPSFHIQKMFVSQLIKLATLHFYQKMVHLSWTKDGQWSDRRTHVMEAFCVSYHMTVVNMERWKGVLLGLLQVGVRFKVLSYRDCRSAVSGCVSGVENEYLFCNFFCHLTDTQAKCKHTSVSGWKKTNKKWLMPSSNISGLFAFTLITLQVNYQVWDWVIGTWVLVVLSIEWGACKIII